MVTLSSSPRHSTDSLRHRSRRRQKGAAILNAQTLLFLTLALLALLYYKVSVYLLQGGGNAASGGNDSAYSQKSHQHDEHKGLLHPSPSNSLSRYQDWR
jgi:hypothetical protein